MNKLLFLCFVIFTTINHSQTKLPNVNLTTLNGKTVSIDSQISKDKITVLAFWATWCVPCINELDAISDVYSDWQDEIDLEIIAISTDDSNLEVKWYIVSINGKGWDYLILLDKNQELKRALNISLIPHVIVLKGNKILYRNTGYSPGAEDELFEIIKKYSK